MSTVTATLTLKFAIGAEHVTRVTAPLDLSAGDAIGRTLTVAEASAPDLGPLVALWGPLVDLSWTVDVAPAVIALPGAWVGLASALAVLAWVRR